jgi:hypothetical protein
VLFEEDFEGFARYLAVEQQVFMVQDEEEGSGAGPEVFQVAALDAESAVAAVVWDAKGIVVDLVLSDVCMESCIRTRSWDLPGHAARGVARGTARYLEFLY